MSEMEKDLKTVHDIDVESFASDGFELPEVDLRLPKKRLPKKSGVVPVQWNDDWMNQVLDEVDAPTHEGGILLNVPGRIRALAGRLKRAASIVTKGCETCRTWANEFKKMADERWEIVKALEAVNAPRVEIIEDEERPVGEAQLSPAQRILALKRVRDQYNHAQAKWTHARDALCTVNQKLARMQTKMDGWLHDRPICDVEKRLEDLITHFINQHDQTVREAHRAIDDSFGDIGGSLTLNERIKFVASVSEEVEDHVRKAMVKCRDVIAQCHTLIDKFQGEHPLVAPLKYRIQKLINDLSVAQSQAAIFQGETNLADQEAIALEERLNKQLDVAEEEIARLKEENEALKATIREGNELPQPPFFPAIIKIGEPDHPATQAEIDDYRRMLQDAIDQHQHIVSHHAVEVIHPPGAYYAGHSAPYPGGGPVCESEMIEDDDDFVDDTEVTVRPTEDPGEMISVDPLDPDLRDEEEEEINPPGFAMGWWDSFPPVSGMVLSGMAPVNMWADDPGLCPLEEDDSVEVLILEDEEEHDDDFISDEELAEILPFDDHNETGELFIEKIR